VWVWVWVRERERERGGRVHKVAWIDGQKTTRVEHAASLMHAELELNVTTTVFLEQACAQANITTK
jgi:hypothetical protein